MASVRSSAHHLEGRALVEAAAQRPAADRRHGGRGRFARDREARLARLQADLDAARASG